MTRDTRRGLRGAIPLPEPRVGELLLEFFDDPRADGGGAAAPALDAAEVVLGGNGVADQTDEDGWDEDELFDAEVGDGAAHAGEGVGGEHDAVAVEEEGVGAESDLRGVGLVLEFGRAMVWVVEEYCVGHTRPVMWKSGMTARMEYPREGMIWSC